MCCSNRPLLAALLVLAACGPTTPASSGGADQTTAASSGSDSTQGDSAAETTSSTSATGTISSTSTTASSSTSDTSSSSGSSLERVCPGNSLIECFSLPDCEDHECGSSFSDLDASGCPRPRCDYDETCPDEMRCFKSGFCGSCVEPDYSCWHDGNSRDPLECRCAGTGECAFGGYCLTEAEWPGECCPFETDDPDTCLPRR